MQSSQLRPLGAAQTLFSSSVMMFSGGLVGRSEVECLAANVDERAGRNEIRAIIVQSTVFVAELKQIESSSVRDYRK